MRHDPTIRCRGPMPDRLVIIRDDRGQKLWIITEWDRSVTMLLLPEDY